MSISLYIKTNLLLRKKFPEILVHTLNFPLCLTCVSFEREELE